MRYIVAIVLRTRVTASAQRLLGRAGSPLVVKDDFQAQWKDLEVVSDNPNTGPIRCLTTADLERDILL